MEIRCSFVSKWCLLVFVLLIATLIERISARDDWGVTKFDIRRVTYNWHIENYSHHGKEYGEDIKSKIFSGNDSQEYQWQLQLYPRGHTPESRLYASLYLDLVSKQDVFAKVELAIVQKNGLPINLKSFAKRYPGEHWGFPLFLAHYSLETYWKSYYLPDDVLTISVDITFNTGMIRASKQCRNINTEKCTSLPFTNNFMSDLYVYIEGEHVMVHKAALDAHSAVIKTQLMYRPGTNVIQLPIDVKLDAFKEALNFIYTGKTTADEEMLKKLLALSDRLGMKKLKLYCEQALCKAMTKSSANEILELAKKNNAENLKREAKSYLLAIDAGIVKN